MATSTLIQKLFGSDEIGQSVGDDSSVISNRREVERFLADGAIGAGDLVTLDLVSGGSGEVAMKVIECPAGGHPFGVALEAAGAAGEFINVCIKGFCEAQVEGQKSDGAAGQTASAISAGDYLVASNTTAGTYMLWVPSVDTPMPTAVAVDDVGSGAAAADSSIIHLKSF